jgi:hypothetical protein
VPHLLAALPEASPLSGHPQRAGGPEGGGMKQILNTLAILTFGILGTAALMLAHFCWQAWRDSRRADPKGDSDE